VGQSAGKFFEQYTEKGALILVKNSVWVITAHFS
jgi:hypothetical protein